MTVGSLVMFIIAIGASLLSAALAERKAKKKPLDDTPAILSTRGSWIPRVVGKRRVGYVVGKVWNRGSRREKIGKKSHFAARQKQRIYLENAVHWVAIGPVHTLFEIEQEGKVITRRKISAISHPSGTLVDLGHEGAFYIFWGEEDQPINTRLGDSEAIGITSRWAGICYIEWVNKRLGTLPRWPTLTYVIEARIQETHLSRTPTQFADGTSGGLDLRQHVAAVHPIYQAFNGVEGVGYFVMNAAFSGYWTSGGETYRQQNLTNVADRDLEVVSINHNVSLGLNSGPKLYDLVFPTGGVSGVNEVLYNNTLLNGYHANLGVLRVYMASTDGGPNPAHFLAELLFSQHPHGLERDKALFDMESFEVLGELMEEESLHGSFIAQDGLDVQGLLGAVMQDLGVLMPIDPTTGLIKVVAIREPTEAVVTLTPDYMLDIPETEVNHGPRSVDKIVFTFIDSANRYRPSTIGFGDDGQISRVMFEQVRDVQIVSTVHFESAAKIVERRSSEELSGSSAINFRAVRAARTLIPGQAIFATGFAQRLRVMAVEPNPDSDDVTLSVTNDFYAKPLTEFVQPSGDPSNHNEGIDTSVQPDFDFRIFEVPEAMNISAPPNVLCLRIRAANSTTLIHVSSDGITYLDEPDFDDSITSGGRLLVAIDEEDLYLQTVGPTFQEPPYPSDLTDVLNLATDLPGWRAGRQMCAIDDELFFLKGVTDLGGGTWRLDGLIRARHDTRPATHDAGRSLFIFQSDDGIGIEINPPITPEATLYMKSQPIGEGGGEPIPLDVILERTQVLYGKGTRPVPVSALGLDLASHGARHSFTSAGDLGIRWGYSTPRTQASGAGNFQAGLVRLVIEPEGKFLVEILTVGNTLKRSDVVTDNSYTYLAADRTTDGLTATTFKVRVTQQRDGVVSDPVTQTLTKE